MGPDLIKSKGILTDCHANQFHANICYTTYVIKQQPWQSWGSVNILRPRQNGRHFADDTFKCIFMNENVGISINISLKFVPKVVINNIPALVQIMAWRRPGDKPLSEPMMVNLLTHICVTWPQWVKDQGRIQYKDAFYHYSKYPCGDKMVVRSSYLNDGISYTGKMTSLYWIKALAVND